MRSILWKFCRVYWFRFDINFNIDLIDIIDRKVINIKIYEFWDNIKSQILIIFHDKTHDLKKLNLFDFSRIFNLCFSQTFKFIYELFFLYNSNINKKSIKSFNIHGINGWIRIMFIDKFKKTKYCSLILSCRVDSPQLEIIIYVIGLRSHIT